MAVWSYKIFLKVSEHSEWKKYFSTWREILYLLSPVYTGDFCRATRCNFCRTLNCNFKIARVNHLRFCCRDIAKLSNMFETWCNSDCIELRDKNRLCKRGLSSHVMLDLLYECLLYGRVPQGLGTTELRNLIGWNQYWQQSRFSHLDRRLDRLPFVVKMLQTKIQKYLLPSKNTKYKWQQAWRAKNGKKDKKTLEN